MILNFNFFFYYIHIIIFLYFQLSSEILFKLNDLTYLYQTIKILLLVYEYYWKYCIWQKINIARRKWAIRVYVEMGYVRHSILWGKRKLAKLNFKQQEMIFNHFRYSCCSFLKCNVKLINWDILHNYSFVQIIIHFFMVHRLQK